MHVVPRVGTRGSRVIDVTVPRCRNYISASLFFCCICASCSFTGLDVFFFPHFARCACIGVYTRERTSLEYTYVYSQVRVYFLWVYMRSLVNVSFFAYMRDLLVWYVYILTLHAIGIHEKVRELYSTTHTVWMGRSRYTVLHSYVHRPSWVTSATKTLKISVISYIVLSVETVRIFPPVLLWQFVWQVNVEFTMKSFPYKRILVLLKLLNVPMLTPWQILWCFILSLLQFSSQTLKVLCFVGFNVYSSCLNTVKGVLSIMCLNRKTVLKLKTFFPL